MLLIVVAGLLIFVLSLRTAHVPIRQCWRRRHARTMCEKLCGPHRDQPPALVFARVQAMNALAFEELLLTCFERRGHKVIRNHRYTGDGGIDGRVVLHGRIWLIRAKRYASVIRPEHVQSFAAMCPAAPARFVHSCRSDGCDEPCGSDGCSRRGDHLGRPADRAADGPVIVDRGAADMNLASLRRALPVGMHTAIKRTIPFLLWWGIPSCVMAGPVQHSSDEHVLAGCIHRAARGHRWLEKTLWGLRDQEGGWVGAEIANPNGSFDLGPLQINSWWIPRLAGLLGRPRPDVTRWLRDDACFNTEVARWIFLASVAATGDYWKAVGSYHSPTATLQKHYTVQVAIQLRKRFGATVFRQAQSVDVSDIFARQLGEITQNTLRQTRRATWHGLDRKPFLR
ncbi:restriction endonuclease [Sphingomonas oryzagri]